MKYYLSLCCIIKNERYLEEFIVYHHIIGVEHFYIYDNNSYFPIRDRLNHYYFKKICTIIDFPGKVKQLEAYQDCISHHGNETEWLAIIDGDEYIVPKKDLTIKDILRMNENAQAIGINWVMFGSSFHDTIQDSFLIDKYRRCEEQQNHHIKSIVKPRFVNKPLVPHFFDIKEPSKYFDCKKNIINSSFNTNYTIDMIQINHYHFRSTQDYIYKCLRGNADNFDRVKIRKNHHKECNDIVDNYLPDKYLEIIKYHYKMITKTNPKIYYELNPDIKNNDIDEFKIENIYDHMFLYAYKQNRPLIITDKYPDFDLHNYKNQHPELNNLLDEDIEIHFIQNVYKK